MINHRITRHESWQGPYWPPRLASQPLHTATPGPLDGPSHKVVSQSTGQKDLAQSEL